MGLSFMTKRPCCPTALNKIYEGLPNRRICSFTFLHNYMNATFRCVMHVCIGVHALQ